MWGMSCSSSFNSCYVGDEGDLVTVDLDEEWADCVAPWRESWKQTVRRVTTCPASGGARGAQVCARRYAWDLPAVG